jgi:hypothetical protein
MAKNTPAALDEDLETEAAEPTTKQVISEGIVRVVESTGVDGQKARYKAMRAIAFQAFSNAIADGTFDDLVEEAIANADSLPSGWELERGEKAEKPAPKAKATKAPARKPAAKTSTGKTAARRRPAR